MILDTLVVAISIFIFWFSGHSLQYFFKYQASKTIKNISAIYLGLYFYTLLFIILGLIHKLTVTNLIIASVFANILFVSVVMVKSNIDWKTKKIFELGKNKKMYILHVIAAIFVYRNAIFPIDGFDALAYHLYAPYSALYHTHTFDAANPIPNSGLPIGTDAIYGLFSLFGSPQTASIFNVFYVVTSLILVNQILRHKTVLIQIYSVASVFSLFLFLGPIFSEPGTDLPLIALGLLVLSLYLEKEKNSINDFQGSRVILLHLFLGFMAFTKPSVLIFIGTFWIAKVCLSPSRMKCFVQIVKISPITLTPLTIWFIKNYLQSSNPVIPFGTHIFKGAGYGPEVTSTDSDIRSSYRQVFKILTDKESYKFIIDFTSTQNTTVLVSILFISLLFLSVRYIFAGCRDSFLIAIVYSEILTMLIAGPIFRYFGYLFTMHLVLLIQLSKNKKTGHEIRRNLKEGRLEILQDTKFVQLLFFVSVFGVLNLTNTTWNVDDGASLSSVSRLSSGSTVANQAITFVKSNVSTDASICLVGDSRAMLFWPLKVSFLQADRSNPFADPEVFTNDQILRRLKDLQCDYLVLTPAWGFPSNVNLPYIRNFVSSFEAMISNEYYSVYDVGALR